MIGIRIAAAASMVACVSVSLAVVGAHGAEIPDYIAAAVADTGRPPADRIRDGARKPAEAVAFSGVKPGDVVADFVPGGGYFTRLFSRAVGPQGRVYALVPMVWGYRDLEALVAARTEAIRDGKKAPVNPVEPILHIQNITAYHNVTAMLEMLWQYDGQFSLPEQVDIVWTSDNYHDLHNQGMGVPDDVANVDKAIFAALKPGGTFVVIDHAAADGAGFSQTQTLHRSDPAAVKAEVLSAGFVLDGQSNMLANPADDHTKPAFQMHDHTDQYALRFKKPADATGSDKRPPKGSFDGYYGNTSIMNRGLMDGPPREERRHFYHPDGTYQEFGLPNPKNPDRGDQFQAGLWYWDAAGRNCMLHQYPATERGFVVCHQAAPFHKVGDTWTELRTGTPPPTPLTIIQGYHPLPDPRAEQAP